MAMYGDYLTRPLNAVTGSISNVGGLVPAGLAMGTIDWLTGRLLTNVNIGGGIIGDIVDFTLRGLSRALEIKAYMLAGG